MYLVAAFSFRFTLRDRFQQVRASEEILGGPSSFFTTSLGAVDEPAVDRSLGQGYYSDESPRRLFLRSDIQTPNTRIVAPAASAVKIRRA